jgi:hypothetical protein
MHRALKGNEMEISSGGHLKNGEKWQKKFCISGALFHASTHESHSSAMDSCHVGAGAASKTQKLRQKMNTFEVFP